MIQHPNILARPYTTFFNSMVNSMSLPKMAAPDGEALSTVWLNLTNSPRVFIIHQACFLIFGECRLFSLIPYHQSYDSDLSRLLAFRRRDVTINRDLKELMVARFEVVGVSCTLVWWRLGESISMAQSSTRFRGGENEAIVWGVFKFGYYMRFSKWSIIGHVLH